MSKLARTVKLTLLAAILLAGSAAAVNIKIVNESSWTLKHFYLSPVDDPEWGPDQLGDEVVATGDSFTLSEVPCATYDVMLIDEDDDEWIVEEVDICGGKEKWVIDDEVLLGCQRTTSKHGSVK